MVQTKVVGDRGEAIAKEYLRGKGFRFVSQNYHGKSGEIDLVFYDPKRDEYIFVEVKTRTSDAFGGGEESITPGKIEKILSAAEDFFLQELKLEDIPFFRVDAVIVRLEKGQAFCEYIEDIGVGEN